MSNPYEELPPSAFWRPAVAQRHFSQIGPLWTPKFDIRPEHRVATYGSCFSQHIGRALKSRGFGWLSTETPPPTLSEAAARAFNYNVFSSRVGNIYTTSLLLQWTRWALLADTPPSEVWFQDGRYYDPFRPAIEHDGFASAEEVEALRAVTIKAFSDSIRKADFLVFTLGLTECWRNRQYGYEYPACPGTIAGVHDPENHEFHFLNITETLTCLSEAINLMKAANNRLRIILTVSPVPLTATNSGNHVMVANTETKSILRVAAGELARTTAFVDYFPSYEMVTNPVMRGMFYAPNLREISQMGVDFVMDQFLSSLRPTAEAAKTPAAKSAPNRPMQQGQQQGQRARPGNPRRPNPPRAINPSGRQAQSAADIVCEEELLAAFDKSS